jgi:hypothetical protein
MSIVSFSVSEERNDTFLRIFDYRTYGRNCAKIYFNHQISRKPFNGSYL